MELLKIRIIQVKREARLLGFVYSAAILLIFFFLIYRTYFYYLKFDTACYAAAITVLLVLSVHLSRGDKGFVITNLENPRRKMFNEYLFIILPLCFPALFTQNAFLIPAVLLFVYGITYISYEFKKRTRLAVLGKIISPRNFEWLGGIRSKRISFLLVYAAALASSGIIILPLLFLLVLTMIVAGFYKECEPLNLLFEETYNNRKLLLRKILRHTVLLAILFAPVLIINSVFNPASIIINVVFVFVQSTILILAILFKYRLYTPCDSLPGNEIYLVVIQVLTVLPFVMGGIPFMLPLPLFLCIRYYFSASKNIKEYVNA